MGRKERPRLTVWNDLVSVAPHTIPQFKSSRFITFSEKALERDYFMTGMSPKSYERSSFVSVSDVSAAAKEALEFGIVDGILEKRPKTDSSESVP